MHSPLQKWEENCWLQRTKWLLFFCFVCKMRPSFLISVVLGNKDKDNNNNYKWSCHRRQEIYSHLFCLGLETISIQLIFWRAVKNIMVTFLFTGAHEENWSRRLPVSWSTQHTGGSNRSGCLESRSDKSCHIVIYLAVLMFTMGGTCGVMVNAINSASWFWVHLERHLTFIVPLHLEVQVPVAFCRTQKYFVWLSAEIIYILNFALNSNVRLLFSFLSGSLKRSSPRVELSNKSNPCVIQLKGEYLPPRNSFLSLSSIVHWMYVSFLADGSHFSCDSLVYDTLLPKEAIEVSEENGNVWSFIVTTWI